MLLLLLLLHDSIWLQLFEERLSTEAWSNYDCWRLCRSNYSAHDAKYDIKEQIKCAQVKRGGSKSMSLNFSARLHVLIKKYYQKTKITYNIKKKKFNFKKQTNKNYKLLLPFKTKEERKWVTVLASFLSHSDASDLSLPAFDLYKSCDLKEKKVLD